MRERDLEGRFYGFQLIREEKKNPPFLLINYDKPQKLVMLYTVCMDSYIQCVLDVTNSVLTNHPGLTNRLLTSNIFLLHKNFGFSEFPALTNNAPSPKRFVKSGRHCIYMNGLSSILTFHA